jgi:hypothetical protein
MRPLRAFSFFLTDVVLALWGTFGQFIGARRLSAAAAEI